MFVTQEALYQVLARGIAYQYVPRKLENDRVTASTNVDITKVCNGVVHPITNETLTNYKKVIQCPQLREVWMKAMCKELGNITQGY